MRRLFWMIMLLLIGVTAGLAQERHPITFDDFIAIKRVSDPQPSPDGRWVAFTVTVYSKESNRGNSDIWLVSTRGGEPRPLTHSPAGDFQPRWSPDGKTIAFISTRGGSPQIHLIPVNGGEARQLTAISTGAIGPVWSADGRHILFHSRVYPDCQDDACNKAREEAKAKNPVKAQIWDRLLYRHWNEWTEGKRNHVFIASAKDGSFRDLTPGDYDSPPIALGGSPDYAISPDGREVCYVKNTDPVVAISTNNDLFVRPVDGGPEKRLTTNKANDNHPVYSPDGRYIAYLAMRRPGFESDRQEVMLYDRRTGEHRSLTADLDRSARNIVWGPKSKYIYFLADDQGYYSIYRVSIKGGDVKQLTRKSFNTSLRVTRQGKLVFLRQAINRPADVWIMDGNGKNARPLTDINRELLARLEMNPLEEFWFEGAGGTKVHGLMVKPPEFDPNKKYPLIYLVHGGPQGAWHDSFHYRWNAQMFAAPGYVVVMVNPRGSTGYGQKFTDEISRDWGGKVFEDLKRGWEYVVKTYPFIDADRMAAAGASYGGYMMYWFQGHEQPFKCLVAHDGVFNLVSMYGSTEELWFPEWEMGGPPWENPELYRKWSPSSYVKNFKTPMLIVHSQRDYRVDVSQGFEAFTALQRMGVPSKFLYFPDEDHFVTKPLNAELWWKTLHAWFAEYLQK